MRDTRGVAYQDKGNTTTAVFDTEYMILTSLSAMEKQLNPASQFDSKAHNINVTPCQQLYCGSPVTIHTLLCARGADVFGNLKF